MKHYINKIELAKTSVDWGIQIVRIDFNIKDVEKQLKNEFIKSYLTGLPTDIIYVPAFQPIQSAVTNRPLQAVLQASQQSQINTQIQTTTTTTVISEKVMERQASSGLILNPAKLETHDAPKYVPYVTLPEETFAKMTQISN